MAEEEMIRIRVPSGNEVFGIVEAMLGANKLKIRCQDDKIRICRIPGRLRKKIWIDENDIVLVEPWKIQGDKNGDVIWKYTPAQVEWLKRKGLLKI